jgi:hypothetical protein
MPNPTINRRIPIFGNAGASTAVVVPNKSAQFTAANSEYLNITDAASSNAFDLGMAGGSFTIGGWVNLDSTTSNMHIFSKNGAGNFAYRCLFETATGTLKFTVSQNGTAVTNITSIAALSAGVWTLVCCVFDNTANTIGISTGVSAFNTNPFTFNVNDSTADFTLGASAVPSAPSSFFDGRMDQWFVYSKALSLAQKDAIANAGTGITYASADTVSLVEWWALNEDSGTRVGVHAGLNLTDNNTVTSGVPKVA